MPGVCGREVTPPAECATLQCLAAWGVERVSVCRCSCSKERQGWLTEGRSWLEGRSRSFFFFGELGEKGHRVEGVRNRHILDVMLAHLLKSEFVLGGGGLISRGS